MSYIVLVAQAIFSVAMVWSVYSGRFDRWMDRWTR